MGRHSLVGQPTQAQQPWRTVVRTVLQAVIGIAAALPLIVQSSGLPETATGVGVALAVAATITRVMAMPIVNGVLQRYLPWLAAVHKAE